MKIENLKSIARAFHSAAQMHTGGYDPDTNTHRYSILECCKEACMSHGLPYEFGNLMVMILDDKWNEVLEWADSIKDLK